MSDPEQDITHLLNAADAGDPSAAAELLPLVYAQLRAVAQRRMFGEAADHTLTATALVHEAYLRLVGPGGGRGADEDEGCRGVAWNGRAHFFHAAAEAMRRILIDHARARRAGAGAHGGPVEGDAGLPRRPMRMPADVVDLARDEEPTRVLALDSALARLAVVDGAAAQVVRLRFYAGLSGDEAARALGVSARQVDREWAFARAWLADALRRADGERE